MAALTTRAAVLGTAPELSAIADPDPPAISEWRQALADVEHMVPVAVWGDLGELAQRLWVAHLLTLSHPELERRQLSSVTMGGMSKAFAVGPSSVAPESGQRAWLMRTRHGQQLAAMQDGMLNFSGPVLL